jgi:hypothetical protein
MKLTSYIKQDSLFLFGLILSLLADIAIGFHAYSEVFLGRWNETFNIGFVSIPKFLAPGATNLGVALLMPGVFVALIIGIIFRYRYYRDELTGIPSHKTVPCRLLKCEA